MVKEILVGVCDRRHTLSAAMYASEIARQFSGRVSAIAATEYARLVSTPVPMDTGHTAEFVASQIENNETTIREAIDLLIRQLDGDGVENRLIQDSSESFQALINASRYQDLMIFGMQGLLDHGVASEPSDEFVRLADANVRPILAVGVNYRPINRVLIGYSGSHESAMAMRAFANTAIWPNAAVKVVHFTTKEDDGPTILACAKDYLSFHGYEVEVELRQESPNKHLLEQAKAWGADLIVLGNSSKSLWLRKIYGETALRTIRESDVPLFLA